MMLLLAIIITFSSKHQIPAILVNGPIMLAHKERYYFFFVSNLNINNFKERFYLIIKC